MKADKKVFEQLRSNTKWLNFEEDDIKGRERFISLFKNYFKSLDQLEAYNSMDLSGITKTGIKTFIEVKIRGCEYSVDRSKKYPISGSTWIEETKMDEFKRLFKQDPNLKLVFICFFGDCYDYISFDVTNRLKARTSEVLYKFESNQQKNNYTNEKKDKYYYSFCFNSEDYDDKLFCKKLELFETAEYL